MRLAEKKNPDQCPVFRCTKMKADKKRFCHRHHAQNQKETNLLGHTYSCLKQNAKRRGKEFNLTIEEFSAFCSETNYLELKGKTKNSASIDRIDPNKGYEVGNLQVLSIQANSAKQWTDKNDDCPF